MEYKPLINKDALPLGSKIEHNGNKLIGVSQINEDEDGFDSLIDACTGCYFDSIYPVDCPKCGANIFKLESEVNDEQ